MTDAHLGTKLEVNTIVRTSREDSGAQKRRLSNWWQWVAPPTFGQMSWQAHVASTTAEFLLSDACNRFECFWLQNQQHLAYLSLFKKSSSTTGFESFHVATICLYMGDRWGMFCAHVVPVPFYSVLSCSVPFRSVLFCSVRFCSVLFCSGLHGIKPKTRTASAFSAPGSDARSEQWAAKTC